MVWKATNPEHCIQYNANNRHGYEDISCLLTHYDKDSPLKYLEPLSKTYMDWEFSAQAHIQPPSYKAIIWTIVASAIIMSFGNFWMLYYKKPSFQIRPMVTIWNVFWMILTGLGFIRLLPMVVHNWYHYSIQDNVCAPAQSLWTSGTTGLWGTIWIYAKMLEVIVESVLVVLLKQPCGLLQWFNNYAYVLVHGWHLNVSPVPGGSAVICIYYAIVWIMNCYCFYLNWNQLPQPTTPTALLDSIHLVQTLSGVFLSVTTLHYWKQSIWMNHRGAAACAANEPHIRMLAFGWSGGHVVIALLSYLNKQFVKSQQQRYLRHINEQHKKHKQQQHQLHKKKTRSGDGKSRSKSSKKKENADNVDDKAVSFETDKKKKARKKKTTTLSKEQLPKGEGDDSNRNRSSSPPEMVEESTSSNKSNDINNDNKKKASASSSRKEKKKKLLEKRNKNIPNSITFDSSQKEQPQQQGEDDNNDDDDDARIISSEQPAAAATAAIIAEPIQEEEAEETYDADDDDDGDGDGKKDSIPPKNNNNGRSKKKKKKSTTKKTKSD